MPFGLDGDLGSEGDIGHLCRDISKDKHSHEVLPFPSLSRLRDERVRHIILLTDVTLSGEQGLVFLSWMWASRTIRSWHSGHLLRFHYVTYIYNMIGREAILGHAARPSFSGLQASVSGHPDWTPTDAQAVQELCHKYGTKKWPLGFRNMMSLQVLSYSCPNNAPSILRYGCPKKGFEGLFRRRPTNVSGHAISGRTANVAAVAQYYGLAAETCSSVVCHVLQKSPATAEGLSARIGLPLASINHGLNDATKAGYLEVVRAKYKLTPQGISFARSLERRQTVDNPTHASSGARFDYLPELRSPATSTSDASEYSEEP